MKEKNLKVLIVKFLISAVIVGFFIMVILLLYYLSSIESKPNTVNKKIDGPKEACIIEAKNLQAKCSTSSIPFLDLKTLEKCDWLFSDKDEFLLYCEEDPSIIKLINIIDDKNIKASSTVFWNQIIEICEKTKIGDLTAQQLTDCKSIISNYPEVFDENTN